MPIGATSGVRRVSSAPTVISTDNDLSKSMGISRHAQMETEQSNVGTAVLTKDTRLKWYLDPDEIAEQKTASTKTNAATVLDAKDTSQDNPSNIPSSPINHEESTGLKKSNKMVDIALSSVSDRAKTLTQKLTKFKSVNTIAVFLSRLFGAVLIASVLLLIASIPSHQFLAYKLLAAIITSVLFALSTATYTYSNENIYKLKQELCKEKRN